MALKVSISVRTDWLFSPFGNLRFRIVLLLLEFLYWDSSTWVFNILAQSDNTIRTSLLAMISVEVIARVVRIVIVLKSVDYWRSMFIVDFYVSKNFLVLQPVSLVRFHCYFPDEDIRENKTRSRSPDNFEILKFSYDHLVSKGAMW